MTLTFKEIIEDLRNAKEENIIIKAFICFITSSIFLVLLGGGLYNLILSIILSILCLATAYLIDKDQKASH